MATIQEQHKAKELVEELIAADSVLKSAASYVKKITSKYQELINSADSTEKDKLVSGLNAESLGLPDILNDLTSLKTIADSIENIRPKYKG